MEIQRCFPQKLAKLFIAGLFLIGAVGFTITGFTVLPIIGFGMALPFAAIAFYLIKAHLNRQCEIDL